MTSAGRIPVMELTRNAYNENSERKLLRSLVSILDPQEGTWGYLGVGWGRGWGAGGRGGGGGGGCRGEGGRGWEAWGVGGGGGGTPSNCPSSTKLTRKAVACRSTTSRYRGIYKSTAMAEFNDAIAD